MGTDIIFGYCVGGLALLSTISSILFYCRLYLPATQIRLLDDLLVETKEIYRKANDEGLLPADVSTNAELRLQRYEDKSDVLREITYRARTYLDIFRILVQGHTRRIMRLADKVEILRALLMTVSQNEKARRATSEGHPQCPATTGLDDEDSSEFEVISELHPNTTSECDTQNLSTSPRGQLSDETSASTCFLCSLLEWTRNSSRKDQSLPSFVVGVRSVETTTSDVSSRSSTLVDEPLPKSTSRAWASLTDWTFLRYQTNSVSTLTPDDIPQTYNAPAASLPV